METQAAVIRMKLHFTVPRGLDSARKGRQRSWKHNDYYVFHFRVHPAKNQLFVIGYSNDLLFPFKNKSMTDRESTKDVLSFDFVF